MVKIRKKVIVTRLNSVLKCIVYELDYSGHLKPLSAQIFPLKNFFSLKINCFLYNLRNGSFWRI